MFFYFIRDRNDDFSNIYHVASKCFGFGTVQKLSFSMELKGPVGKSHINGAKFKPPILIMTFRKCKIKSNQEGKDGRGSLT